MEEVKAQLSQQLQEQNLKKQFDALKAKAKIEIVGAPAPAPIPPALTAPAPK
jgi:peptidyl-prolyl cis-trans isomerase C